jgi:hypothetical protein
VGRSQFYPIVASCGCITESAALSVNLVQSAVGNGRGILKFIGGVSLESEPFAGVESSSDLKPPHVCPTMDKPSGLESLISHPKHWWHNCFWRSCIEGKTSHENARLGHPCRTRESNITMAKVDRLLKQIQTQLFTGTLCCYVPTAPNLPN